MSRVRVEAGERPRPGEVWAFTSPQGELIVHRCLRGGRRPRFQGDANLRPDDPVTVARLVGRVIAVETEGRWRRLTGLDRGRGLAVLAARSSRRAVGKAGLIAGRWLHRVRGRGPRLPIRLGRLRRR